jgi:phosphohistidine swiveling domain-containing protein
MSAAMFETNERETAVFAPPGPGFWELESTHHGLRPLSHVLRAAYRGAAPAMGAMLGRYGMPIASLQAELVEGCLYLRPKGVGEGDKPSAAPPAFVMKVLARLHPELRRRNRTAAQAWAERRWRREVDQWFEEDRAPMRSRNLELQRVDVASLDDEALAAHLDACMQHFATGMVRNLETHGGDLVPVGDLLAHGDEWGIDHATMASMLAGSSPGAVETAARLRPVAIALASASSRPTSIEEVRALGADVAAAVDAWIEEHAWRLMTSDDVDRPTLAELPTLQLQALLAAIDLDISPADVAPVRTRVPAGQRDLFDGLIEEARYGLRQRDDIRGQCWDWPGGLVRRALLEIGRRLVAAGRLVDAEHIVELEPAEVSAVFRGEPGPDADTVARRASRRDEVEAMPPPRSLGQPEPEPPLDALPAPMARAARALMTMLVADATVTQDEPLHGVGIGDTTYVGRALVIRDAADALAHLQPGDVLIAPFTGPSFNSFLPLLGALVVEEGGPMCHAAIVSREFGLSAVIGALGATSIPSGATVEVNPIIGVVRVLDIPHESTVPGPR